jgi:hypothetical protein
MILKNALNNYSYQFIIKIIYKYFDVNALFALKILIRLNIIIRSNFINIINDIKLHF